MRYRDPNPSSTTSVFRIEANSEGWLIWAVANTSVVEVLDPGSCAVRATWAGELPVLLISVGVDGGVEFHESAEDKSRPEGRYGWVRECGGEPLPDSIAPRASP
jgi:hypothetical protein